MFQQSTENTEKEIVCPPVSSLAFSLIISRMRSVAARAARGLTGSDCHPVFHLLHWPDQSRCCTLSHTTPHHISPHTIRSININIYFSPLSPSWHHRNLPQLILGKFDRNIVGLSVLFPHFNTKIRFYWNKKAVSVVAVDCGQFATTETVMLESFTANFHYS